MFLSSRLFLFSLACGGAESLEDGIFVLPPDSGFGAGDPETSGLETWMLLVLEFSAAPTEVVELIAIERELDDSSVTVDVVDVEQDEGGSNML